MLSAPRPLLASEHDAALALWPEVFQGVTRDYFTRYYDADENYRPGDTFGIWDGETLASAAHLCRRPVAWSGGTLLCGGLANVATRENYRRLGLSRLILREIIAKMEREQFDFSLLGTGTHGHYAALGWEQIPRPQMLLSLRSNLSQATSPGLWQKMGAEEALLARYDTSPRPLQFVRSSRFFRDWTGWVWDSQAAEICQRPTGYAVADFPPSLKHPVRALEWRAGDALSEIELLGAVCAEAVLRGYASVLLTAAPQFADPADLYSLGEGEGQSDNGGMVRRVMLSPDDFALVSDAYRSGRAAWWEGDGF